MPAKPPALFPSLAGDRNNIDVGDEDFGDFMFSSPSSSNHTPFFFPYSTPNGLSTTITIDEDWGDFVASHLGSHCQQPQSSTSFSTPFEPSPPSSKACVKPKGAIPLSIFGEEEDEKEDLVEIEGNGVFENGFGFCSSSTYTSLTPATAGKLNDLVGSLYGQIDVGRKEEEDDFDEASWEFKDALSADAIPKVVGNRLETGLKDMDHFNVDGQEIGLVDVFAAHEKLTNRSLGHNHSVTDKALPELLPSFGNGASSSGTNGFKIEFPENAIMNGFAEKNQVDQANILHSPEKQEDIQEEWKMWDFDDLNISAHANGKKNLYENHVEIITGAGKMDYSPVALTSNIHNLYEKTDSPRATFPSQNTIDTCQEIDQLGKASAYVNGDIDCDLFNWEFRSAEAKKIDDFESWQSLMNESTSYSLVDLYCGLKEESLSLIANHLAVLKVPALPGETPEVKNINEEIQEAYGDLLEMVAYENACPGKQIASNINQLLYVMRTSNFIAVERECHLSERLHAAEKCLNAAVDLFQHSSSILQILRLASREQQLLYINAWSKLSSACAEELQLGAKIWTESSLDCNISKQMLTKGNKYFLALGEVYRVSKILKATVRFYMPWLLSNLEDSSDIVTCLEKGNEAWISSGLEEALQRISRKMDLDDKGLAKPLLDSIKIIDEVNEPTFQDIAILYKNGFCKFTLLPLDMLPGIKTVAWNDDCYITKIANFWANRISPDPPGLPSILPSQCYIL